MLNPEIPKAKRRGTYIAGGMFGIIIGLATLFIFLPTFLSLFGVTLWTWDMLGLTITTDFMNAMLHWLAYLSFPVVLLIINFIGLFIGKSKSSTLMKLSSFCALLVIVAKYSLPKFISTASILTIINYASMTLTGLAFILLVFGAIIRATKKEKGKTYRSNSFHFFTALFLTVIIAIENFLPMINLPLNLPDDFLVWLLPIGFGVYGWLGGIWMLCCSKRRNGEFKPIGDNTQDTDIPPIGKEEKEKERKQKEQKPEAEEMASVEAQTEQDVDASAQEQAQPEQPQAEQPASAPAQPAQQPTQQQYAQQQYAQQMAQQQYVQQQQQYAQQMAQQQYAQYTQQQYAQQIALQQQMARQQYMQQQYAQQQYMQQQYIQQQYAQQMARQQYMQQNAIQTTAQPAQRQLSNQQQVQIGSSGMGETSQHEEEEEQVVQNVVDVIEEQLNEEKINKEASGEVEEVKTFDSNDRAEQNVIHNFERYTNEVTTDDGNVIEQVSDLPEGIGNEIQKLEENISNEKQQISEVTSADVVNTNDDEMPEDVQLSKADSKHEDVVEISDDEKSEIQNAVDVIEKRLSIERANKEANGDEEEEVKAFDPNDRVGQNIIHNFEKYTDDVATDDGSVKERVTDLPEGIGNKIQKLEKDISDEKQQISEVTSADAVNTNDGEMPEDIELPKENLEQDEKLETEQSEAEEKINEPEADKTETDFVEEKQESQEQVVEQPGIEEPQVDVTQEQFAQEEEQLGDVETVAENEALSDNEQDTNEEESVEQNEQIVEKVSEENESKEDSSKEEQLVKEEKPVVVKEIKKKEKQPVKKAVKEKKVATKNTTKAKSTKPKKTNNATEKTVKKTDKKEKLMDKLTKIENTSNVRTRTSRSGTTGTNRNARAKAKK